MRIRFVSKGPIDQVSGGYLYNRYLMEQLREANIEVIYYGSAADLRGVAPDDVVIVDSLVIAEAARQLLTLSANLVLLLHMLPESGSAGVADGVLDSLYRRSRVVVTGDSTLTLLRQRLTDAGVDAVTIEPGVPHHWRSKQRYADRARRLLGVANYVPDKGIARLLDVLSSLRDLPWSLTVRGSADFDADHFEALRARIRRHDLEDRVALLGPVPHDAINLEMLGADLLVHFSQHESYSMVTAEAIACGLPVLSYRTGNFVAFDRSGLVRYLEDDATEATTLGALIEDRGAYRQLRRVCDHETRTWQDVGRDFLRWLGTH